MSNRGRVPANAHVIRYSGLLRIRAVSDLAGTVRLAMTG